MNKVLITGITGFLGAHIAEQLVKKGIDVIGLKRSSSDIWRCQSFSEHIYWLNIDDQDWKNAITEQKPDVIIHCAWIGVEARERDDWNVQVKNIGFLIELLDACKYISIEKFIFLGSQAEYGQISGQVDEEKTVVPENAYGAVKFSCMQMLKSTATIQHFKWIWLRVFTVFGEKEGENWLIPSVIKKMKSEHAMDFTLGEQKYAYLYVKDFANILYAIVKGDIKSGIYNVSSNEVQMLKNIIETIRKEVNPEFVLNFGAIPYRKNQSMHIEGNNDKLIKEIGSFNFTDFNVALSRTIKYYRAN